MSGQIFKNDYVLLLTPAEGIKKNSRVAQKLLQALLESELIVSQNAEKIKLRLSLSQAFLPDLADQAEWKLYKGIAKGSTLSNDLDLFLWMYWIGLHPNVTRSSGRLERQC